MSSKEILDDFQVAYKVIRDIMDNKVDDKIVSDTN